MIGLRALVVRNLTLQSITEAVGLACGLASAALLSRHLGVAGYGAFNYVFAFTYFFLSLNDLGLNTIAVREISRDPSRASEVLGDLLSLRLTLSAFVLVIAWVTIAVWPMDPTLRRPLALFALILPLGAFNTPALLFQTAMRFELAAVSQIVLRVSGLALLALMAYAGLGVMAMLGALLAAEVIGLLAVWTMASRLTPIRWHVDVRAWRAMLRAGLPLATSILLVALLNRADFIMLERLAGIESVGLYGAAYRVTGMLEKFPLLVMGTLYPIMSRLALDDPARLRDVYRKALLRFAGIGLVAGGAVAVMAGPLLAVVFGEPFREGAPALRWLIVATGCLYLAMTGGNLLIAVSRPGDNVKAIAAGTVVNIGLNLVLIPARGIEGAAIATAASLVIVLGITLVCVERHFAGTGVPA
jgi:O-antigen/teichoic acid export membrane protein